MEDLKPEMLAIFQELFDIIDTEHNNILTYKELDNVLNAIGGELTESEIQGMINQGDMDGNGSLDFTEFAKMLLITLSDTNDEDTLREAFKIYDKDNNGFISTAELRTIYISIGLKLSDEEIEELIREADIDQDGVLLFEEFMDMMMNKGP